MPVKSEEMTSVLAHLKCTYHRVRLGGGGNRVVGCGYKSFCTPQPNGRYYRVQHNWNNQWQRILCVLVCTTRCWNGTQEIASRALWGGELGWGLWLGELSGLHKNPIQPSSPLQNIDNHIMKLKVWMKQSLFDFSVFICSWRCWVLTREVLHSFYLVS